MTVTTVDTAMCTRTQAHMQPDWATPVLGTYTTAHDRTCTRTYTHTHGYLSVPLAARADAYTRTHTTTRVPTYTGHTHTGIN